MILENTCPNAYLEKHSVRVNVDVFAEVLFTYLFSCLRPLLSKPPGWPHMFLYLKRLIIVQTREPTVCTCDILY